MVWAGEGKGDSDHIAPKFMNCFFGFIIDSIPFVSLHPGGLTRTHTCGPAPGAANTWAGKQMERIATAYQNKGERGARHKQRFARTQARTAFDVSIWRRRRGSHDGVSPIAGVEAAGRQALVAIV